MSPALKVASAATYSCPNVPDKYLAKLLGFRGSQIQASDVSQCITVQADATFTFNTRS